MKLAADLGPPLFQDQFCWTFMGVANNRFHCLNVPLFCLVLSIPQTYHLSHCLASLHWLPADSRIQCKLVSPCYNCLSSTVPGYLTAYLKVYKATCQLCLFF